MPRPRRLVVPAIRLDVGLVELAPVDIDVPVALAHRVAREADQALDEDAAGAAAKPCLRWRLEDDDLASLRASEVIDEAVREDAVAEARLATRRGPRAMQRRLHRRGR